MYPENNQTAEGAQPQQPYGDQPAQGAQKPYADAQPSYAGAQIPATSAQQPYNPAFAYYNYYAADGSPATPAPRSRRPLFILAGIVVALVAIGGGTVAVLYSKNDTVTARAVDRATTEIPDPTSPAAPAPETKAPETKAPVAAAPATRAPQPVPTKPKLAAIGETVRDGDFAFVVTKVACGLTSLTYKPAKMTERPQNGQFCVVVFKGTNTSKQPQLLAGAQIHLVDTAGSTYDSAFGAPAMAAYSTYIGDNVSPTFNVNPGTSMSDVAVYDVPAGVKPVSVELHGGIMTDGAQVAVS